jgi:exopolyphosphatase/guanosine-5'-triphosphate,3'-diphosphate pyrophosphatase
MGLRLAAPTMSARLAVIDIGSNTANCAVYAIARPGALDRLADSSEPLKLMRRLGADGAFSAATLERTLGVLRAFRAFAREHRVDTLVALATSAVRDARNGDDLARAAARELGVPLRIIDGEEEGRLAAWASSRLLPVREGLMVDLGGGSAQLVEIVDGAPGRAASLPLGALRLTDRFGTGEVVIADQVLALRAHVDELLASVPWLPEVRGRIVGVGGTIRALGKVDRRQRGWNIGHGHGYWLGRDAIERQWEWCSRVDAERRKALPGLAAHRVETVTAGVMVVARLLALREARGLCVNSYGVREGAALQASGGPALDASVDPLGLELAARFTADADALRAALAPLLAERSELDASERAAVWIAACVLRAGEGVATLTARPVHGADHDTVRAAIDLVQDEPREGALSRATHRALRRVLRGVLEG